MSYLFNGNLKALLCDKYCTEVLAGVKIRLYRTATLSTEVMAAAVAAPKETFHQVSDEEQKAKTSLLLAETITDEQGNFSFTLGEKQRYAGEAFDIDFVCGNVPRPKPGPKKFPELQFHITTLQPRWAQRENDFTAAWVYVVPARWWCLIRSRFDAWVICGRVMDCKNSRPIAGVKVSAFDVDWIQDDPLGSGTTDSNGYFRIDYTTADFSQTILSPLLNVEWPAGPDLYFTVQEPTTNAYLLKEDRSIGHSAGRSNRGPCFCVDLCASPVTTDGGYFPALWEAVGDYKIHTQINADGYTIAPELYAFTGTVALNGKLPNGSNTNAMQYRFRIFNAATNYELTRAQVNAAMPAFVIGQMVTYHQPTPPPPFDETDVVINPALDPEGWITVPRGNNLNSGGLFSPSGLLGWLNTAALALNAGGTQAHEDFNIATPSPVIAGSPVPGSAIGAVHTFRITFESRELNASTLSSTDTLNKIVVSNVTYLQRRHPSWNYTGDVTAVGAGLLEIQETTAGGNGCGTIGDAIHVNYTVAHPHMDACSISFEGNPVLPATFTPPVAGVPQISGSQLFDTSGMQPCAYIVWLNVSLRLTTGSGRWTGAYISDHIAFCKKPAI